MWNSLMHGKAPATLGFSHGALDRAAQQRSHSDVLQAFEIHEEARFILFCGDNAVLQREGDSLDAWFARAALPVPAEKRQELLFLGLDDGRPRFAYVIDPEVQTDLESQGGLVLQGLRALAMERSLPPEHLGTLAEGKALAHWHVRHRFCSNCGAPTVVSQGGWRRDCAACGGHHFPRTDPVVIMLTVAGDRCLLGRQTRFPPGVYSTLAGFVEPGETIEDAVRRETFEEAGIRTGKVAVIANQPWPFPASLMIGAIAEAESTEITRDEEELEDCRWFSRDEIVQMIERNHPQGLTIPPRMAIANHLIRAFVGRSDS